jgi:hypothetical protein
VSQLLAFFAGAAWTLFLWACVTPNPPVAQSWAVGMCTLLFVVALGLTAAAFVVMAHEESGR